MRFHPTSFTRFLPSVYSKGATLARLEGQSGTRQVGWTVGLFAAVLAVYLFTRLYALADYPIYFFTDEAVQSVLAGDFLRDHLRNYAGAFLPTYFNNVYQYNLSLSVYLQVIPTLIFGHSLEVTRASAALVTLLAPLWVGLSLRAAGRPAYTWLAALLLSITPGWFLHSRTAFECSLAVTFYAGLIYFYLRYRGGQPGALYGGVACAALCFYSYSPAQVVVAVTALLFLISDLPYHWQQRATLLRAVGLGLVCGVPYLQFQVQHPNETLNHLRQLGSFLILPVPWTEKLGDIAREYLRGLDPIYWYGPSRDIVRHTMDGFGNLATLTFPFGEAGVCLAAWRFSRWEYRVPLLAALAAPSGAALVGIGITRALFMVVPMAILAALATGELVEFATRRWQRVRPALSGGLFILLVGFNFYLLGSALSQGPTWSTDYGLQGMQYGARQVFGEVQSYVQSHPGAPVVVSPTWANGTNVVSRFFLPDPSPVMLESIDHWLNAKNPLDENMLFVLPAEEFERAQTSGKFSRIDVEKTLPYPDGRTGFYFVRLVYMENIDDILAAELEDRQVLESIRLPADGQEILVQYSRLDMGTIGNIFDGDDETFIRSRAANPLILKIEFPTPRKMRGFVARIGGQASIMDVAAEIEGEPLLYQWRRQVLLAPAPRPLELDFEGELLVRRLEIRLKNTIEPEPSHVHLWELTFQ